MAIVKVSQLAKEMDLHTDAVISMLHKLGHGEIKAHNSTIDDSVKKQILDKRNEGAEMAKQRFADFQKNREKELLERKKGFALSATGGGKSNLSKPPHQNQGGERQQANAQGGGEGGTGEGRRRRRNRSRNRNRNREARPGEEQNLENRGDRPHGDRGERGNDNRGERGERRDFNGQRPHFGGGQGERGDRPYGDRPRGDRPYGDRPHGDRPHGDRERGERFHGDRPRGDRPYGDRERGERFHGDRPHGDRPHGDRPHGDRPHGDRPHGDRQNHPRTGGGHFGGGQRGDFRGRSGNNPQFSNRDNRDNRQGNFGANQRDSGNPIDTAFAKELAEKQALLQINESGGNKKKKGGKKHSPKDKFEKRKEQEFEMKANVRKTLAEISGGNVQNRKKYKKDRSEEGDFEEGENNIIHVSEFISVSEFAKMVEEDVPTVIGKCMGLGLFVTINQRIDFSTIQLLAEEFGFEAQLLEEFEEQESESEEENKFEAHPRPPVVTVMGHVDHGKTSLLDYIRRTNVVSDESGGITQHIAAYSVKTKQGAVTFLDTPGHEAFAAMRARGSQITDVVVLIVAADSSVMPQTKEAIDHAKAAGVPIVVAINKIDLPTANPDKIKGELASYGVLVESYGGQVQSVEISAKKGIGVDDLLELLALETGMLDIKAPIEGAAKGVVIESELDKGKGALATVLIQSGTLRKGDVFYTGVHSGKVREMLNEQGQKVKEVKPGYPAIILGLSGTPQAGDNFRVCKTEKEAREIAAKRRLAEKERELRNMQNVVSLANLSQKIKDGKMLALNLIVRGDVDGSVEVVAGELQKLSTDEIKVNIILKGVGGIKETDIMLARASGAIIIGFNINPNPKIKSSATDAGVEIKTFRIIYELINQVRDAMIGMLAPDIKEEVIGQVEIRELFKIPKVGIVAGSYVLDGKIERNALARLIRDDIEIAHTKIDTLQRFKDQVKDVAAGFDCGLTLAKVSEYKIGDRIEVYKEVEIKRKSLER